MSATLWQPDPGWTPVVGGPTGGVWRSDDAVVKRLVAPGRGAIVAGSRPSDPAYWRREADVALDDALGATPGLRRPATLAVEEDPDGITVTSGRVETVDGTGPFLARSLGVFAAQPLRPEPWWTRDLLAARLLRAEERGGWPTLARTTLADVSDRLWQRRGHHLGRLSDLPQVPAHGDPTPANLPGRDGDAVLAVDWASFGVGPVGADVGYLALSVREDLDVLVEAYADGYAGSPDDVATGATVMACYTALTRTEWALARAAAGSGALAAKYKHPAVAPYIRSLQRLFPQLETLL